MSAMKRPAGVTVIAILWFFGGLINIGSGLVALNSDIAFLPSLSDYGVAWLNVAIPIDLVISIVITMVGLIQLVAVAGLLSGKKYAYRIAFAIPILSIMTNLTYFVLYASAPYDLVGYTFASPIFGLVVAAFWLIVYWTYFNKPHVKIWLKVIPAPVQPYYAPMQYPPSQPAAYAVPPPTMNQPKIYCRYCGAQNTPGTLFCGQCGKPLT